MNSGPLSLRMHRGTPRIASSSASVSITSSLVMFRSTFKARHSRVFSSIHQAVGTYAQTLAVR
jgi:hypothetical protein